jgi:oxaloacetate decarboxylase alpha subunit
VFSTARNLEAAGHSHALDLDAQAVVSEHFFELARVKGLPAGAPREFDGAYYRHQLPGGMVTTTRRMLEDLRRPELFDRVLEEVTRVRAEMGYPILVTPVSQFVASQAARNVIDGERWVNVSDETVRYFLGHYGPPAAPVDPEIGCCRCRRRTSSAICVRSRSTVPASASAAGSARRSCCCG